MLNDGNDSHDFSMGTTDMEKSMRRVEGKNKIIKKSNTQKKQKKKGDRGSSSSSSSSGDERN